MEDLPPDKRPLGSQWVYKIKYNSDGSIERLKSRLVVFGNHQKEGIDYTETFAPVAKMVIVRAFLAMSTIPFFMVILRRKVSCKLMSLYMWMISVALRAFKAYLIDCFHMKDLGTLKYFLGIEVARSSSGLFLCQIKYTLEIITKAGLLGSKPAGFPMEQNHRLGLASGPLLDDPEPYLRLVGRLIYLAVTRPDLAYSVHILSQFMHAPRTEHWEAALRVVRYLKGTPGQGIFLRSDSELTLQGWCDSDWAACPLTRRSLTGWIIFLGKSPISWKIKKQKTVSTSSSEAEYRCMCATTMELMWLKRLLLSLGVQHPKAIKLFCDSQSALHIAKNSVFHERTKHIEVDCHFVRDAISKGFIDPSYVSTREQGPHLYKSSR
ncbi:uncharacterized protein LOC110701391 [Chenopodium quinoa]|uniref:uncharacterized protein LOC110701391 n=1 Tax=Chenopodium quinoa TaxID=63459 RepID=UPI000B798F66|nr:uncharacterized protein LOC110701391 [Chenopodium quinoa]